MFDNIFSFENQNVRVAVMTNGGAYARSLTKDNHSVESTTDWLLKVRKALQTQDNRATDFPS